MWSGGLSSGGCISSRGARNARFRRLTGAHRDTITRAVESDTPPWCERKSTGSSWTGFGEPICEQLQADSSLPSQRLWEMAGELGYVGGKTVSTISFARCGRGLGRGGRFSGPCIGLTSWCSAIRGSRGS